MEEMSAFEHQVAVALQEMAGPGRRVDAMVVAHIAASRSPGWRLPSMFSAAKLVVAAVVVVLFAGFVVGGLVPASPQRQTTPGALTTAMPSATASVTPSGVLDVSPSARASGQPRYQATARLRVDPGPDPSLSDLASAAAALVRYAGMAETLDVVEAVTVQLGVEESPARLLERVTTHVSPEGLELSLLVADDDPEAARAIAQALGDELRQRSLDSLITAAVRETDAAIARTEKSMRLLQARYEQLARNQDKNQRNSNELILLAGEISALQRDIQALRPSSRAYVRDTLAWLEEPVVGERSDAVGWRETAIPTRTIAVASEPIERGTVIGAGQLTPLTVPVEWADGMALVDGVAVLGVVAAIDIPAGQLITTGMLLDE